MARIECEIAYLECVEGGSNKWYVGIDLGRDIGKGILTYGGIGRVQSATIVPRSEVPKRLAEKRNPRKGYIDEPFGRGWDNTLSLQNTLVAKAREALTLTGTGPGDAPVAIVHGGMPGSRKLIIDTDAIAATAKSAAPPEPKRTVDRSVFDDW